MAVSMAQAYSLAFPGDLGEGLPAEPSMQPLALYIPMVKAAISANPQAYALLTVAVPAQALADAQRMVGLLDRLVRYPPLQQRLLAGLPAAAQHRQGDVGSIFSCLDYHLTADGLRLIEGNTHASGGVASALWQAHLQQERWLVQRPLFPDIEHVIEAFWRSLECDWTACSSYGARSLFRIAIVDDDPPAQPYYQEFLMAQALLQALHYQVQILDARDLQNLQGADLVYNRCCDFYLEAPEHQRLREAYLRNEAVFTPSPHMHAIIGRKDLLVYLHQLADGGWPEAPLAPDERAFLRRIVPEAHFLTDRDRDEVWRERKRWVFKPRDRYQGKGVYRGKSLSHTTFETLPPADYIVQEYVPPSVPTEGFKAEIRFYHHGSTVQFGTARVYAGQVTNFRNPGGGNAPLVLADSPVEDSAKRCQTRPKRYGRAVSGWRYGRGR